VRSVAPTSPAYTADDRMDQSARWLVGAMLALLSVGIVMVASASAVEELAGPRRLALLSSHLGKVLVALLAFLVALRVPPRWLYRGALPAWVGSTLLIVAVLLVGVKVKGARRWLDLGFTTFQPSELARLCLILAIGAWAARTKERMGELKRGVLVPFALAGVPAALVLLEPDFGSSVYMRFMGVLVLWVGGARPRHLLVAFLSALGAASLYGWERLAHVSRRVSSFREPEVGGQVWQSLTALGHGHWGGQGLGAGPSKWGYVPEAENDFILAVIGEELGLLGTGAVVVLYALLLWHGVRLLLGVRTRFALVVGAGLLFQVIVQALLNVAVVTAAAPPKGLPLPFISAGGSSLLTLSISMGLFLGLARRPEQDPVQSGGRFGGPPATVASGGRP